VLGEKLLKAGVISGRLVLGDVEDVLDPAIVDCSRVAGPNRRSAADIASLRTNALSAAAKSWSDGWRLQSIGGNLLLRVSEGEKQRILVVWDPCWHSNEALAALSAVTDSRPAAVELVAVDRPQWVLAFFALSTGLLPENQDAEEQCELVQRVRAFEACLPDNLAIRSSVESGRPCQVAARLIEHNTYDVVLVVGPSRASFRRRALARRLEGVSELMLVPARRRDHKAFRGTRHSALAEHVIP
jgi:hypothetical protein